MILLALLFPAYSGPLEQSPLPETRRQIEHLNARPLLLRPALPYECSVKKDVSILGVGLLCAAGAFALENSIRPLSDQDVAGMSRNSVNGFDRSATYHYAGTLDRMSDLIVALPIAAPLLLLADKNNRRSRGTIAIMYGEALLASYTIPTLTKGLIQRSRPFVYNPDAPLDQKTVKDARFSFFSQHTTFAFSTACFLSTTFDEFYPTSKWRSVVWASSLACAATVGVFRYESGAHFPSDILTGAAVGSAIGLGVPWIHRVKVKNPLHLSMNLFGIRVSE
jgi:membrane-associated phospholipid phosphatase